MSFEPPVSPSKAQLTQRQVRELWAWAQKAQTRIAELEAPTVPPPQPSAERLLLVNGVVLFESDRTSAGYSGGVLVLAEPNTTNPWWRQTTQKGAWDWKWAKADGFRSGSWQPFPAIPVPVPVPDPPVPIPTPPPTTGKAYMDHWMLAFSGVGKGMEPEAETISRGTKYGLNVRGLFADGPLSGNAEDDGYGARMVAMMDACKGTGVRAMPWCHMNGRPKQEFLDFAKRTLSHECVWRPNGRPVLAWYSYYDVQAPIVAYLRQQLGYEFDLYASPYVWDDNQWLTEHGQAGGRQRVYTDMGSWYLPKHPEVQGIINFAADYGVGYNDPEALMRAKVRNTNIAEGCKANGRVAVLGWNAKYYTDTFTDEAVKAQLAHMESLNGPHVLGWCVTTGNDLVEKSYVNDVGVDFATENGEKVVYLPPRGTFRFGDNVPYPSKVQTRYSDLALPCVKRFRGLP